MSAEISLSNGVLTLTGNPATGNKLTAEYLPDGNQVLAAVNGQVRRFPADQVDAIKALGGAGSDRVYVNPALTAPATVQTLTGNDTVLAGGGNDVIDLGAGNDFAHGYAGNDRVEAGDGDDRVWGGAGHDTLNGGLGNDYLDTDAGNDVANGGAGDDRISGGDGDGDDALWGDAGHDRVFGWAGDDSISAGAGNDYVVGGSGADRFDAAAGDNRFSDAGPEDRFVDLAAPPAPRPIGSSPAPLPPPAASGPPAPPAGSPGITLSGGALSLTGSANAANKFVVEYFASSNKVLASINDSTAKYFTKSGVSSIRITGGSQADKVYVNPALTAPATIDTFAGNDTVLSGNGPDTVRAGDGNDQVKGYGGNDRIDAGAGDDTVYGYDGNDTADGGVGNDTAFGGNGDDALVGGTGNDWLGGDAGNDDLRGGGNDDRLAGGDGADRLYGEDGSDLLIGNGGPDTLDGGAGGNEYSGRTSEDRVVSGGGTTPPPVTTPPDPAPTPSPTPAPSPTPTPAGDNTVTVYGTAADSSSPRAAFKLIGQKGMAGHPVHVNSLLSTLGRGTPITARYEWDFGDPTGRYNKLVGFNAAHVYDRPGTYKVTLTVTNELGKRSTVSTNVTVAADTRRTIYVDAAAGSDANDGSSASKPVRTVRRASTLLQSIRNDVKVLFKRGQRFDADMYLSVAGRNVLIGAYGSGADPVLRRVEGTDKAIVYTHKSADRVVVQDLTMDSKWTPVGNRADHVRAVGVYVYGRNVAVRDNTFLNLDDAVNANGFPTGLLVMDNDAPLATGLRGYFVWGQGDDHVYVGNTVANSTREHVVRTWDMDRVLVAHNNFTNLDRSSVDPKDLTNGTIEIQAGTYAYVANNVAKMGQVRVGPRGGGWEPATAKHQWSVFENNQISGVQAKIFPGTYYSTWRNNVIRRDKGEAFSVTPTDGKGRTISDVNIVNNTVVNNASEGNFLMVIAGRSPGAITLRNNLWLAPNIVPGGGNGVAGVYVHGSDLGIFKSVANNVWPKADRYHGYAPGGAHYVWPKWSDARGYLDAGEWEAQGVVSGEVFSTVPVDSRLAPLSGSAARTAGRAYPGVFADLYGKARPLTGTVTAGAVQG